MKNQTKSISDLDQTIDNISLDEELKKLEKEKSKSLKNKEKKKSSSQKFSSSNNNKDNIDKEINEFKNYDPKPLEVKEVKSDKSINNKMDINTQLVLNIKTYNKYIDYLPSDFTEKMVLSIFVIKKKMNLPKQAKLKIRLLPNDTEKTLKVIVTTSAYYKYGTLINQTKMFEPFWIIGFNTYSLIVTETRPIETKYRVNNVHAFAYSQSQKMKNKRIAPKNTNKSKSNYEVEQDFIRARDNKNWYLKQYVDSLNRMKNIEWECHPRISVNWSTKVIKLDLYLKLDKIKDDLRKTKWVYADSFTVKAARVLDVSNKSKIVDIDSLMYLVALNAIYKNVKIFSYKSLYEAYKILVAEIMVKGFKLKEISASNLSTLKIIDFSTHFSCNKLMFNDSILHIMNLMSSHEDYYRMKYAYTVQKDPSLLFSDFIVKEFKKTKVNELSTIIKNHEEKYWNEQIKKLDELNTKSETRNKDYYINNYNVLELSNNAYKDVESYLMGVIKGEKDEITRISKLGQELLKIDEDPRFTKKESAELKKVAKKLDDNYKELFKSLDNPEMKNYKKVKPIKIKERKKKVKKDKNQNNSAFEVNQEQQYASNVDYVNNDISTDINNIDYDGGVNNG